MIMKSGANGGDRKVVEVLCIGQYDREGKFTTIQWKSFMEWCKTECNRVVVYTRMPYRIICKEFPLYCDIGILEKPDRELDVYVFKIDITNILFWNYIANFNYDIDRANDISYIFFFSAEKYIASLEIVDCDNYVLLEEDVTQKGKLLENNTMVSENIQLCFHGKADIDELSQEESWKPLGAESVLSGR